MNKHILITGATDGIGKITAQELAQLGNRITIHGRNEKKAERVVTEIKRKTGNQKVDYLIADLTNMTAVANLAKDYRDRYQRLDVLINNAGAVLDDTVIRTRDGLEQTFALNVMAPFLLSELLLPALEKSLDARIINMSSGTYRRAKPDLNDMNSFGNKSGQSRYGISKLFVIANTITLAQKLQNRETNNVTVNVSHPGAVATNFGQNSDNGWLNNTIYKIALRVMPAPEKGAVTNVYLASSDKVKGVTGKFFNAKKQIIEPKNTFLTPANRQKLWDYCQSVANQFEHK